MPLEIKELHIKVTVNPGPDQSAKPAGSGVPAAGNAQPADQSAVIAACVEQVLEILKEKLES